MADQHPATTLVTILTNQLLLLSTAPYLSVRDIRSLTLTSRALYNAIASSPSVHRYLDLSARTLTRTHKPPPLTRILAATPYPHRILHATRTLILDNTPITETGLRALIAPRRGVDPQSTIQLLSIRGCDKITDHSLMALLASLVTSHSATELSLKGVYWFTPPSSSSTTTTGRTVRNNRLRLTREWVPILQMCAGRIVFDTVVCGGHAHSDKHAAPAPAPVPAQLANVRLGGSGSRCRGCGAREAPRSKALVAPAPLFGGVAAACSGAEGVLRCEGCVKERWCECCGAWWCEACAGTGAEAAAEKKRMVKRTCFECGSQCAECTARHSRVCLSCKGGYCITHNDGAEESYCEWCVAANVPRRGSASSASSSSNAFLTSPAKAYYLSLGPAAAAAAQKTTTAKPRTVSSGTPFRAATNVPLGGRQFQREIAAATTRRVGML